MGLQKNVTIQALLKNVANTTFYFLMIILISFVLITSMLLFLLYIFLRF